MATPEARIRVSDVASALEFYEFLGFKETGRSADEASMSFPSGRGVLFIKKADGDHPRGAVAVTWNDPEIRLPALRSRGIMPERRMGEDPEDRRNFHFSDPDGNSICAVPGSSTISAQKFIGLVRNAGDLDEIVKMTSFLIDHRDNCCCDVMSIVRSSGLVSVTANAGRGQPDRSLRDNFDIDLIDPVRKLLEQRIRLATVAGELKAALVLAIKPKPLPKYPEIVLKGAPSHGPGEGQSGEEIAFDATMTDESLGLALAWHDGETFHLPKVAARIAETAVMEWFRNAGQPVRDLSIGQIESPGTGDWLTADIGLSDGTLVDVKNTTRSLGRTQHTIKQFKVHDGVAVRYVGTVFISNFGPGDRQKFYEELFSKGKPVSLDHARQVISRHLAESRILLLGATTREEVMELEEFAKARTADVIFNISGNASATPPFVWNPWDRLEGPVFQAKLRDRDAAIETTLRYPEAAGLQDPVIFLSRNLPAPGFWSWERRAIHEDLRKILNGALPDLGRIYLSLLQHFLDCCKEEHDGINDGSFLPKYYEKYFADCELWDPGGCFKRLLGAIGALVTQSVGQNSSLPALSQITITDAGTVIAVSGHPATPNRTLLANCVGCGASLVFGSSGSCAEERLICEHCGACSCGAYPDRSETCNWRS